MLRDDLRQTIISERKQLNHVQRTSCARQVATILGKSPLFQRSQHIAFYTAINGELNPDPLLQLALQMNKNCYLPVLHPLKHNRLLFAPYNPGDKLIINHFGIQEPSLKGKRCIPSWALDLVFTPLVAFDENRNRLGMGKGYYDRTFAFLQRRRFQTHPFLVGLAYEFQKTTEIKSEPWDVPLHMVVTEMQVYKKE